MQCHYNNLNLQVTSNDDINYIIFYINLKYKVMLRSQIPADLIPKETLVRLMLDKATERSIKKNKKFSFLSPSRNNQDNSEQLDFDDYIRWCCGYRHLPSMKTLKELSNNNILSKVKLDNYKLFAMVVSGASYHQVSEPHYYDILLRSKCMYPELYFSNIQKDIHRTLCKSIHDSQSLKNILSAYAIRNPNLIYCQGLNVVVANLLMSGFSQTESFWMLTCLIQQILPPDYYVDLKPIICLNSLFNDMLKEFMPGFYILCEHVSLQTSFFFVQWMVTIFGKGFSRQLTDHIRILVIIQKQLALIKTALIILKIIQHKLQKTEQFGTILKEIQEAQMLIPISEFKQLYSNLIVFTRYLEAYIEESNLLSFTRKINMRKKTLPPCNPEYQVCLHVVEIQKQFRHLKEVQTIRVKEPLEDLIFQDYFDQKHIGKRKSKSFLKAQFLQQVKVGRHRHICTTDIRQKIKRSSVLFNEEQYSKDDIQNLRQGQSFVSQISPTTCQIYQDLTSQFEVISIPQQQFQVLLEDAQQKKSRSAIVRSLSLKNLQIQMQSFNFLQFLGQIGKKILDNGKK